MGIETNNNEFLWNSMGLKNRETNYPHIWVDENWWVSWDFRWILQIRWGNSLASAPVGSVYPLLMADSLLLKIANLQLI